MKDARASYILEQLAVSLNPSAARSQVGRVVGQGMTRVESGRTASRALVQITGLHECVALCTSIK